MTEQQERKLALVSLAEYLQVEITEGQLLAYTSDLEDINIYNLHSAIRELRLSGENFYGKFPLPSVIRKYVHGSKADVSLDASLKIIKSISKFGWPNHKDAKEFIGELGWAVVEAYGGWPNVCRMVNEPDKISIYQPQFQRAASMLIEKDNVSTKRLGVNGGEKGQPLSLGSIISGFLEEAGTEKTTAI